MTIEKVTFLHAADVHLGAPVRGLRALDDQWANRLQNAIAESWERVIATALDRNVDFVVLAGDMFDTSRPSYGDYLRFFEGLQQLDDADIPVYLVTGNHDPYTSWKNDVDRLPENVRLLGVGAPEFALFARNGKPLCLLGGRSYYNQTWPDDEGIAAGITRENAEKALAALDDRAAQAPFTIGIIHTGLHIDLKKAPADEASLLASGIDYWACGHLHKRFVRPSDANPRIVFPGCVQGRDMKETGQRGCFIVELEEGRPAQLEFVPTSSVVLQNLQVNASACRTLADLERHIQAELFRENGKAHCEEMIVRVTLVGETKLHGYLMQPNVLDGVRKHINNAYPSFFCDALVPRTRPVRDRRAQTHEELFPALVMQMAAEQRAHDEQTINYIQSELVKRGIAVPNSLSKPIGEFIDAAETLVLDLLEEEGDR